jgi:hypothetical protein
MNRGKRPALQILVEVLGIELAGIGITVDRPQEAEIVGLAIGCGEGGCGRRRCHADNPSVPQDRRSRGGRARAVRPDHRHDVRYRRELGRCRLATFGVALAVLGDELDRMADELVADLVEGDLHGPLLVEAERCVGAGQRPVAANHDRRVLRDLDDPDVIGDGALGFGSLGGDRKPEGRGSSCEHRHAQRQSLVHLWPPS